MKLYRLAKAKHVQDLSGMGARIAGGRWNEKGTAVVYAAESRSLAAVEYLVHVPIALKPRDLRMAVLEVPDSVPQSRIAFTDLPPDWNAYPAPPELAEIGTRWVASRSGLLLFVPSSVVPGEFNVLIDPSHPDMKRVKVLDAEGFEFDPRLLR
jgi:RES domain-containing protein